MNLTSDRPFWPLQDGLPATFPALERDERCAVAVIGAGVTGALVAWHLAEAGVETVVLDRREAAHGSTSASTSLLQYELDEPMHVLARRLGEAAARRAYSRCRSAVQDMQRLVRGLKLDCGFETKLSLQVAHNAADVPGLRREFEARRAAGFAVDWWPRRRLAAESTLPHPAGMVSREAAQVDAYRLTYGLLTAARRVGARVYDGTTVTRRRAHPRGVELRTNRGAAVRAAQVVIATGYEADELLPRRVTALHSTFAVISEPVASFAGWPAGGALIWETGRPYLYFRTTPDGRCIGGGYDVPFRDAAARDRLVPRKAAALQRRFRQFFPRISFELAASWAGTFAETATGLPLIGPHPRVPRTWFALGYGGNGVTFSLIAAQIIRAAMLGDRDPDTGLFGFEHAEAESRRIK